MGIGHGELGRAELGFDINISLRVLSFELGATPAHWEERNWLGDRSLKFKLDRKPGFANKPGFWRIAIESGLGVFKKNATLLFCYFSRLARLATVP
ncbi:MAG: hypothetical protein F6J93_29125 [Oscillatoria sp. SIO1A7]|nr:hypothetical protein [Oscillatoria sp. SIO1A7]